MAKSDSNKYRLRKTVMLNIILFAIQAVIYMTPLLNRLLHYDVRGFLFFLWVLSTLLLKVKVSAMLKEKHLYWFMVYAIWMLLMSLIGHSARPFMVQLAGIPCLAIPFVGYIVVNYYNTREQGLLFKILFLIISINLISNYYIGLTNPMYFDIEHMEGTDAYSSNAGSSSYVASLSFLAAICFIIYYNTKVSSNKLPLLVSAFAIICYLLFFNPRATTAILLVIALVGIFVIHREPKSPRKVRQYYVQIFTLILVVIIIALIPLFSLLENVDNERLASRFSDIQFILQGGSIYSLDNSSLAGRFLLGMTSLNTFFSSPLNFIWGIGDDVMIGKQYEFSDLLILGIGNHSQFLDMLAKYGLIGGIIFVNIIKGMFKWLKKFSENRSFNHYIDLFIFVFFFQSVLNNSFFPDLFIIIFIMFPILLISNNRDYEIITNKC